MAYKRNVEIFEEAYEKKDAKSVVSYVARDGRRRYIAGNKNPDGGGTPMPSGGGMVEIKWQELKDKRDNGELNPGSLYRITDYNCTTTQENTQSANHQFDIVLLALSENKLAEEGWAMEHPTDVYDVTFNDGVTKKCYIYIVDSLNCNIVICDTLLGLDGVVPNDEVIIDDVNKTATANMYSSTDLIIDNLTYNYFQNSNLSAWKVWYCLDNDKSRFAWADDSVDEGSPASIITSDIDEYIFYRDASQDEEGLYAWVHEGTGTHYTENEIPSVGDPIFDSEGQPYKDGEVTFYAPAHEGTGLPNGRGVIYRLIDEWNNDCPYDFKNIVIYLGGKIEKGYIFSDDDGDVFSDMSLTGIFNDITVKKTIDDNNCQVIDTGILVTNGATECCNIIVASGALSEGGVNTLSSNTILGYSIENNSQ